MDQLTLSFFGKFQVFIGGEAITNFRSVKVQGLLIYLALTPEQTHERDTLATLLWVDEPESVAKQNLRQSIYRLRQVLGDTEADAQHEPFLLVTRSTVQFNADSNYSLDVEAFLSFLEKNEPESAIKLYEGELLPAFSCDSLVFEAWLRNERERLHRLALNALSTFAESSLTKADYQQAEQFARKQLELEPWREEAHRQLIQAFALQGDRSAALAQYEKCKTILAEELGVEPSSETKTLATRIREQYLPQSTQRNASKLNQLTIPFIGRSTEYEILVNAYQSAVNHGLQAVMLEGNAGIGKTRLVQQFLMWADLQEADILQGRAVETSIGLSYQPLTHAFRQRIERENAPEDLLSDLWLSQLTRILPELRDRYPDLPEPTQEENTARQHLFEAITRLGQSLAGRAPLIIFIDDWHWADAASLDVLHYAALRWSEEKSPILLLLTLRQEALNESLEIQKWLVRFRRDVKSQQISLNTLSLAETENLVTTLINPEQSANMNRFSNWLFEETDGKPLFLAEILKVLVAEGLISRDETEALWQLDRAVFHKERVGVHVLSELRDIIHGWLNRISNPAVELLTAASVLAEEATFNHLYSVANLAESEAINALDELLGRHLLQETESAHALRHEPVYRFAHQKVSEVVYTGAGAARRRLLHQRAFEILQGSFSPASELAYHALNAGLLAETIHHCLIAGNEAMAVFAVRVAITHYETALAFARQKGWHEDISGADRQSLYMGLGRAYELVEEWQQAIEIYEAMVDYARTIASATMECLGLNCMSIIYINNLRNQQQGLAILKRAKIVATENNDRRGLAEVECNLAAAAHTQDNKALASYHGELALSIARELEHPQLMARCLNMNSYVYTQLRQWEKVETSAAEACKLYSDTGNLVLAADSQRMVGMAQTFTGHPYDSVATLQETFAFSKEIENIWGITDCAYKLALAYLESGQYGEAIRLADQALTDAYSLNLPGLLGLAQVIKGTVQRMTMALGLAEKILLKINTHNMSGIRDWPPSELCAIYALRDDWDQAYAYAKHAIEVRGDKYVLPIGLASWYGIEALLRAGDSNLARDEIKNMSKSVSKNQRYQLVLRRCQAVLAKWDDDTDQAIEYLQVALRLAQEIGLPGEEWQILGELGRLYQERDDQKYAKNAYKAASDIIRQLAMTIDDQDLRSGFMSAKPVQDILIDID